MIDDNQFNEELYRGEYEICAWCGSTHANDKYCPMQLAFRKSKVKWMCQHINDRISKLMGMF